MSKLVPQFTAPSTAAVPPAVPPASWEDDPVFRETFLMYVAEPRCSEALRVAGRCLYSLLLEGGDPAWPESSTRTELRAAAADLRHLQGFLAAVGREREVSSLSAGDARLSRFASGIARALDRLAGSIEGELGK